MNEPTERKRRHFSEDQKATVVRRHLADKVPVSDLADEYRVQPSLIYLRIKQVLDQAERAFRQPEGPQRRAARDPKDQKIAALEARVAQQEAKLTQKNEVIAELMEENVRAKKIRWGARKRRWVPHDTRDQVVDYVQYWEKQAILWELREMMKEWEVETIVQCGLEKFPGVTPQIISDHGPQFIARDFKSFVRVQGLTHVRTSPYYPQSNGKLERWHVSLKQECIRPKCPASLDEARAQVQGYVDHYNHVRLHSAIDYLAPADKLNGMGPMILEQRDQKLEEARARRQRNRATAKAVA